MSDKICPKCKKIFTKGHTIMLYEEKECCNVCSRVRLNNVI